VPVESAVIPLGVPAPDFALTDVRGRGHRLSDFDNATVLVVAFVCNHCPYVQHIETALGEVGREATLAGAQIVAICSNDTVSYPEDDIEHLVEQMSRARWDFPYLIDAVQDVARSYGAVCTPDFFVYGPERQLTYRGAFDGSTPKNGLPVDGALLRGAIAATGAGVPVPLPHRPSLGCSIKWREGP